MIEYFLDPHPDEVLYSVWARLSECLRYSHNNVVLRDLFGTKNALPMVDLPCHLGYFLKNLPCEHSYTLDTLLNKHTVYPLYAPFLPEDRLRRLREQMISGNAHSIHQLVGKLGNATNSPASPPWLRYCPMCVEEDRTEYGECYWHRLHQILGVEICSKHDTLLEDSTVRIRATHRISQFVTAERTIAGGAARKLISSPVNDALREVARAVSSLLESLYLPSDDHFILRQYHALLAQRGFMTLNGLVRINSLLNAFADYYPAELLSLLHCEIKLTQRMRSTWLMSLIHRSGSVRHPLQHILLIYFLGSTVESFLGREIPYLDPFKEGPWPCLNPVCEHYRQRHIQACQKTKERGKGLFVVRRFTCSCGFVYSRSGPGHSDEDLFRRDAILAYGPLWDTKLRELWFDPTIKLRELADQLGVTRDTVYRQAARLQLPVPRTSGTSQGSGVKMKRQAAKDPLWYRTQWTMLMNANPGGNVSELQRISPGVHRWLLMHDKEWLMANRPPSRPKQISTRHTSLTLKSAQQKTLREDPQTRDMRVASAVKDCAYSIMNEPGYPRRVTKRKIWLALPEMRRSEWREAPLTASALQEVLETPETFVLRRIQWFVQKCQREQLYPKRKEFIRSVNIDHVLHLPRVMHALNEAMETLSLIKS